MTKLSLFSKINGFVFFMCSITTSCGLTFYGENVKFEIEELLQNINR